MVKSPPTLASFRSIEGEPHARRQVALLARHPEIEALYGYDRRTSAVIVLLLLLQVGLAWAVRDMPWWWMVVVAAFAGGPINHWLAMGIHEASHNLAARTPLGNRAAAMLANVPLIVPSAMAFTRYHRWHHILLGVPEHDNDLPSDWEIRTVATVPWRKALWLLTFVYFATNARGFLRWPKKWEWINIVVQVSAMAALVAWLGWPVLVYLTVCVVLGLGVHPVAGHWIHEHYVFEPPQETYSYYGPLNWLTFNVGYHNEHHDFMRVPGWRLPEVHAIARETYGALDTHPSWAHVMWRFVWDHRLGHHSRILRSMEVVREARDERVAQRQVDQGHQKAHLAEHGL